MADELKPARFEFFSDDLQWCRETFGDEFDYSPSVETEIVSSAVDDFARMCACDMHIIANSSFSWWAAYIRGLNQVVSPDPHKSWFGTAYAHYNMADLIPETWRIV